ncbi:MAG: branched-chain amino acid aminotransferase [Candidatus Kariarchaeaceae archaeon]|jgi:branched-chain amino acid aminotransferase
MAVSTVPIIIDELKSTKEKPDMTNLGFGQSFTDRMLICKWSEGSWDTARITQYADLHLPPATVVFHYGQAIFEGMKAYRHPDGSVKLFRPEKNAERFNLSARRMVMPEIDPELFVEYIRKLVDLERDWVPDRPGSSLYIRPTMIASAPELGVKPSREYIFFVILSPSGPYFKNGFNPTKIKVETEYVRAVEGGTGSAKASSNYAGSLLASTMAKSEGYDQVLWLDAMERKYIEEVGAMNIAFVINDSIYSTSPRGTILDGVTRRSVKVLAEQRGYKFIEDRITIDSVIEKIKNGELTEIFGIGTAAVISPVGLLGYNGEKLTINNNEVGPVAKDLYDALTGIQYGRIDDSFGWMVDVA